MPPPGEQASEQSGPDRWWRSYAHSQAGASHERRDIECQDNSEAGLLDDGKWAYLVVSDGHGSVQHFRSAKGSEFAVAVLTATFTKFKALLLDKNLDAMMLDKEGAGGPRRAEDVSTAAASVSWAKAHWKDWAPKHVVATWRSLVHQDLVKRPPDLGGREEKSLDRFLFWVLERQDKEGLQAMYRQLRGFKAYASERERTLGSGTPLSPLPLASGDEWDSDLLGSWQATAYGATLLGVLIGPDALYWLQLGDGAMVQIIDGHTGYLVPPPSDALANETPSLCLDNAVLSVNVGTIPLVSGQVPSAVILTSDGLPNSYSQTDGFFDFCSEIASRTADEMTLRVRIPEWLAKISDGGSGDDMSLAMAWSTDKPTAAPQPFSSRRDLPDIQERVDQPAPKKRRTVQKAKRLLRREGRLDVEGG